MKNIILAVSVVMISQFYTAQAKSVSAFTNLKVYDKINVQLRPSSTYNVEITGNKADDVEFLNSGNELKVRMKTLKLLQGDNINVVIYFKEINSVQASQGAKISSNEPITSTKLNLVSNEGSYIDLLVESSNIEGRINTGGSLKLSGTTDSQSIVVNTGGQYDGQNLITKTTSITTNAGGKATVNATESIDAKTRAGGTIDVYGNPATRNDKKVIGGKINYR